MTSKVRSERYTTLKLAIIEKYHSQQNFANRLGITKGMLQARLQGVTGWSDYEAEVIMRVFNYDVGKRHD